MRKKQQWQDNKWLHTVLLSLEYFYTRQQQDQEQAEQVCPVEAKRTHSGLTKEVYTKENTLLEISQIFWNLGNFSGINLLNPEQKKY